MTKTLSELIFYTTFCDDITEIKDSIQKFNHARTVDEARTALKAIKVDAEWALNTLIKETEND